MADWADDWAFGYDARRNRRIEELRVEAVANAAGARANQLHIQRLQSQIDVLTRSVDRLQLVASALAHVIETKGLATRDELEVLVQQIDLLDGKEDGRSGPPLDDAPQCHACGHHVNPAREICIYCDTPIRRSATGAGSPYRGGAPPNEGPTPKARMASCARCARRVPQRETYFTDDGELLCTGCFTAGQGA